MDDGSAVQSGTALGDPKDDLTEVSSEALSRAYDPFDLAIGVGQPTVTSDEFLPSFDIFDEPTASAGVFGWNSSLGFLDDETGDLTLSFPPLTNVNWAGPDLEPMGQENALQPICLQIQGTFTLLGYDGAPGQLSCLFNPQSIEHLVGLYFRHFHRHIPIIHRVSFNPTTEYTPRLIAVVLTGGLYSSPQHIEAVRAVLNTAERLILEYTIQSKCFSVAGSPDKDLTVQNKLERTQAMFLIVVLQTWGTTDPEVRRRTRQTSFPVLLNVRVEIPRYHMTKAYFTGCESFKQTWWETRNL
jgi:hypothetical protein